MDRNTDARAVLAIALSAMLFLWPAIANGLPLVFSDTGTYLRIGTELYFPTDRPITYGLLVWPLHAALGLWPIAILQALITAVLLYWTLRSFVGPQPWMLVALAAPLAVLTSAAWHASQVMPDIATAWLILCAYLLIAPGALSRREATGAALVLLASVASHLSHAPLAMGLAVVGALACRYLKHGRDALRAPVVVAGAAVVATLAVCATNLVGAGRFTPSVDSHHFLVARLLDAGLAQDPLAAICARDRNLLCGHQALLRAGTREHPKPGDAYLWADESPRADLIRDFPQQIEADSKAVISETLRSRPGDVLRMLATGWAGQIAAMRRGDGVVPYGAKAQTSRQIVMHLPMNDRHYALSAQQQGTLQRLNPPWDRPPVWLSLMAAIPMAWLAGRRRHDRLLLLWTIALAGVVGNALICSALSGVVDRYGSRVAWILPACLLISIAVLLRERRATADPRAGHAVGGANQSKVTS